MNKGGYYNTGITSKQTQKVPGIFFIGEDDNYYTYNKYVDKMIDTNCIARGIKYGELPKKDDNLTEYQYRLANSPRKDVKTNLTALGKEFSIEHEYDRLHDAIVDLKLNLKVWNKLKYMIDI